MAARRPEEQHDHYAVLGLAAAVTVAEIRRAYRQLALRYHPDRAGPGGTAQFQRIAEAYRVLSDPSERSRYDADRSLRQRSATVAPAEAAEDFGAGYGRGSDGEQPRPLRPLIERLCGSLELLVARSAAARRPDGSVELYLTVGEARGGGTIAFSLPLRLPCPTCGGVATPNQVWCLRCEFAGSVIEEVTLHLLIKPQVADGTSFSLADPQGIMPASLRVRIRVLTDG